MVWNELSSNLQVIWGALIALGVVILLTPAVGGMARMLGVVDRQEEGRRHVRGGVPRLGGLALFFGIFVPSLAFLRLDSQMRAILLGAAVATTVGAVDDFRGLRWWEKLAGQTAAAAVVTWGGVWVHRFTFPFIGVQTLPKPVGVALTIVGIVAVMNMVNFLDGLDGLAAGVCAISAFSFCVIDLSRGDLNAAILTGAVFGACVGFLRHNFYPARIFMGDSGAHAARVHARGGVRPGPVEDGRPGRAHPAAARARRPADRHVVRRREADQAAAGPSTSPIEPTSTTASRTSASRSAGRSSTSTPGASRSRSPRSPPASSTRTPTATGIRSASRLDTVIALVAIGASVYVVYLLEIVKLANPFIRRREEADREQASRKTA